MAPPKKVVRGVRASIKGGYFLGRSSGGTGPVELLTLQEAQSRGMIPSALRPIGPAGGDLGGDFPNPVVSGLQGVPLSDATPTDGQIWIYDQASNTWTLGALPKSAQYSSFVIDDAGNYYVAMVASLSDPSIITDPDGIPVYVKNP